MAYMRLLRGEDRRFSVTNGAAAMHAGDPFTLTTGTAADTADGGVVHGVMIDNVAIGATNCPASLLVDGQVWEITVASLTSKVGTKMAAAGTGAFNEGTSADPSLGWIVDKDLAATDTTARIVIERGTIA
jgi:hypothetical protein